MENFKVIDYQRERDFSQKMSVVFEFLKQNFKSLSRCMLFIAGPPVAIGSIFISDVFNRFMSFSIATTQQDMSQVANFEEYIGSTIFLIQMVGILGFMWTGGVITIATVYGYMHLYREKQSNAIAVSEVWVLVRKTFGRYFATLTAHFFLSLVILLVSALPLAFILPVATNISPFFTIAFVLGYIALISVGGVNLSMIFIIRANEPIGFFQALRRLLVLVRGKTWSTFGIGAITTIIQSTVSGIFFIPWYVVFILTVLHQVDASSYDEPSTALQAINSFCLILYFICNTLLYALPLLGLAFQYYSLVEQKEARGLLDNLDTFGQAPGPTQRDEDY